MKTPPAPLKIADLARVSGVNRSTIHHYLNVGLLPRPRVEGPKLHLFGAEHVERLERIQALRARGLGLTRIKEQLGPLSWRKRPNASNREEPDGTRRQILEQATRLFAERGYHGVRLIDVAHALSMGKATIYRYFPSKQALFVSSVEQIRFTLIPREVREMAGVHATSRDEASGRTRAVLHNFEAYRTMTHLLGSLARDPDSELASRARAELHDMITNAEPFLRKLKTEGRIPPCDTELLSYMLWGALISAGERLTLDGKYTLEEVLAAYLAFSSRGMGFVSASAKRK